MRLTHHAQVAFLNVLIVMQDWDFPDFSEGEIKISALDIVGQVG